MLIFQTKYVIAQISPFIAFHEGDGCMTEYFEEAYMYKSKEDAQMDIDKWDKEAKEGISLMPVEITCRL